MPVFRKGGKNILFIHVPKNGGSTMEGIFKNSGYQALYLDGKVGRDSINHVRHCTPQHMHADVLRAVFKLQNFELVFMVVRHPLDRFKSEYIWRNRKDVKGVDADAVDEWADSAFERYRIDDYLFDNHMRPQSEFYLPDCLVYQLEIGIPTIVADLNTRFGLSLESNVPNLRVSGEVTGVSSSDVCVSPATEEKIRKFYREDYVQFGYDH